MMPQSLTKPIGQQPVPDAAGKRVYGRFFAPGDKEAWVDGRTAPLGICSAEEAEQEERQATEASTKDAPRLVEIPRSLDEIIAGAPVRWKAVADPPASLQRAAPEPAASVGAPADLRSLDDIISGVPLPVSVAASVAAEFRDSRSLDEIIESRYRR